MKYFLTGNGCRSAIFFILCFTSQLKSQERCIRFYGNGVASPDNDRVKISLTATSPVNVANDFTIECWIRCSAAANNGTVSAQANGDGWISGNIFIDRDVYGNGDFGDFGFAIGTGTGVPTGQRVVAFGIDRLGSGITIRGNRNVADNSWHHIAVTRNSSTGEVRLFVDGFLDAVGTGPTSNINYNTGRPTAYPNSDPFIVLGAEKHDAGAAYPSFNGHMDELRISTTIRYSANFTPAVAAFVTDASTAGLYHFNEGTGTVAGDVSGASGGPSYGVLNIGGSPAGPVWVSDSPFTGALPLSWIEVKAKKTASGTWLTWALAETKTNGRFEIQRSSDGISFNTLSIVYSNNYCSGTCRYSFTDHTPLAGKNIYRVIYRSVTGEEVVSPMMTVLYSSQSPYKIIQDASGLKLNNRLEATNLIIWNSEGQRIYEKKNVPAGLHPIPVMVARGMIFIHINMADGNRYTEKIILR
jgi:hypothetical protein